MNVKEFLDKSPTAWHACANVKDALQKAKFQALEESKPWQIKANGRYFVTRNEGSIIAFIMPKKQMVRAVTAVAHTDSPSLKLKPHGEYLNEKATMLHFEIYGAPILPSWIGRDLYLAGRVFFETKGNITSQLVAFPEYPFIIANLALHLDRQVNENGLIVHKQDHTSALVGVDGKPFLERLFKKMPIHHELYAAPLEKATFLGIEQKMVASARLDNLAHAATVTDSFLQQDPSSDSLKVLALFNYEEIGSETQEGAASTFFNDTLERLYFLQGMNNEETLRFKANSSTLSCDVTHATHPNHMDRHDARHRIALGAGPVIKTSAQMRYVTDASLASQIIASWKKNSIPYQFFSARNDIPTGTTLGPIHAANTGIKTIDIGVPMLGMHAAREVMHLDDYHSFVKGLNVLYDVL